MSHLSWGWNLNWNRLSCLLLCLFRVVLRCWQDVPHLIFLSFDLVVVLFGVVSLSTLHLPGSPYTRHVQTIPQRAVWLQVFVPTSQEHTVWPMSFLKTETSWLNESGLVCCCLVEKKTCSHIGPLWNSLDMAALHQHVRAFLRDQQWIHWSSEKEMPAALGIYHFNNFEAKMWNIHYFIFSVRELNFFLS